MTEDLKNIKNVFFIGIGGIGMSALARYFKARGMGAGGYDRVETPLTQALQSEGMEIHYADRTELIPVKFLRKETCMVVYTPAVPSSHSELQFFRKNGYRVMKRSQVLGMIAGESRCIAVAGTHGKTTISSMIAHIFNHAGLNCNAFLGGISKNLDSNLLLKKDARMVIVEADEFDRSFLSLFPANAVVSAVDADHLDIYGTHDALLESFNSFVSQVKPGGILVYKKGIRLKLPAGIRCLSYSTSEAADFSLADYRSDGFKIRFSVKTPYGEISNLQLGTYGKVNVENAIAALAIALLNEVSTEKIREALLTYRGVARRFDMRIQTGKHIYIDDYAHHPEELRAFITSVREAVPGKRLAGIFQPHLYSRTRDFSPGFSESLSLLDDVILLDIYPAREVAIPGVTSEMILGGLSNPGLKMLSSKTQLRAIIEDLKPEVLLTMGAGDIDQLVEPLEKLLNGMKS
jgi:UDP-N-acetylmuramate--alanine ligase